MSNRVQHLTRSQYVLIYGPGAIIESQNGARIIPSLNSTFKPDLIDSDGIKKFEIVDTRMSMILNVIFKKKAKIFSMPTNADVGKGLTKAIARTFIFPKWSICYGRKTKHSPILHETDSCPDCGRKDSSQVRFVMACINGHLDDVNWPYVVHRKTDRDCQHKKGYLWESNGSSLSDIVIKCRDCGVQATMQDVYKADFLCTGRFPEQELAYTNNSGPGIPVVNRPKNCDKKMKVLQRQSTSLRFADTITLLTIPKFDNSISNILQKHYVVAFLDGRFDDLDAEQFIIKVSESKTLDKEDKNAIIRYIEENGLKNLELLYENLNNKEKSFEDLIYEEYESLSSGTERVSDNFSISEPVSINIHRHGIPDMKVYAVNRLRTVTAQTGYYRIPYNDNLTNTIVPIALRHNAELWYPGFQGQGEGIFIDIELNNRESVSARPWSSADGHSGSNLLSDQRWAEFRKRSSFTFIHTLSHSLIKVISQNAGYSSASLRERIYLERNGKKGGILIYTSTAGEDGSMGGLVGIAKKESFEETLEESWLNINLCSNDPLCRESRKTEDSVNGSACYSCLFISETSCEHGNKYLDRHIILED